MDNVLKDYVTHDQCADYRKDIYNKMSEHDKDIMNLKITDAKISTSLESMLTIGKAMFGAVLGGMITIIVILLTRGL